MQEEFASCRFTMTLQKSRHCEKHITEKSLFHTAAQSLQPRALCLSGIQCIHQTAHGGDHLSLETTAASCTEGGTTTCKALKMSFICLSATCRLSAQGVASVHHMAFEISQNRTFNMTALMVCTVRVII